MIVEDCYHRIVYKVGTQDDVSSRAMNPIVTNKTILDELYDQLKSYANITKGIQDIYSFSLNRSIQFVEAPALALRSQGYFYAYVIVNGSLFPMDFRGPSDSFNNFRVFPSSGITNWLMPWNAGHKQYITVFPANSTNSLTTSLNSGITATDTTIPVASTTAFVNNFGRFTIDSEKIMYEYKDATNFYGCVRGIEQTTAAIHSNNATLTENNVFLFYSRLPLDCTISSSLNYVIPAGTLAITLDPSDEHMEGIIKSVVYNLLLKIDLERASAFKIDSVEQYNTYKSDIEKGYARNRMNVNIRQPNPSSESGAPYGNNLLY